MLGVIEVLYVELVRAAVLQVGAYECQLLREHAIAS